MGTIKDNIVSVLKTVSYQNTIEKIYREDKTTGLLSAEYLYGTGKRIIDKYAQSVICMFNIINIEEINATYGRNIGTELLIRIVNAVKSNISSEYLFVRYMGPKFAIAFSGADIEGVTSFITDLKERIENVTLELESKRKTKNKIKIQVKPLSNFVVATYYKGTGIEEVTKKLEEYLDNCDKTENTITSI